MNDLRFAELFNEFIDVARQIVLEVEANDNHAIPMDIYDGATMALANLEKEAER